MAIVAVNPKGKQRFIPESDKDNPNPTVFFYRPMNELEKADVGTSIMSTPEGEARMPESFLTKLVKKHCLGWENFKDGKDEDIPFNSENLGRIPFEIIIEFGSHIFSESGFGVEERKN